MLARIIAGIAMGGVAFFLIGPLTLLSFRDGSSAVFASYVLLTMMLVGIAIVVLWSASAQAAWSRLCLTDGAASIAFGVLGLAVRGETGWPSGWSYEHEVARAIGPLSF